MHLQWKFIQLNKHLYVLSNYYPIPIVPHGKVLQWLLRFIPLSKSIMDKFSIFTRRKKIFITLGLWVEKRKSK